MIKLNIEMTMAHSISKIARAPGQGVSYSGEHILSDDVKMGSVNTTYRSTKRGMPAEKSQALSVTTNEMTRRFDPTISEILDEDRLESGNQGRLYHA